MRRISHDDTHTIQALRLEYEAMLLCSSDPNEQRALRRLIRSLEERCESHVARLD